MTEYVEGLCSTCRYSSKCALTNNHPKAVQLCEEYEAEISPRKRKKDDSSDRAGPACPNADGAAGSTVLGLCSDCENRKGCSFPKPRSGVWHCEEYR